MNRLVAVVRDLQRLQACPFHFESLFAGKGAFKIVPIVEGIGNDLGSRFYVCSAHGQANPVQVMGPR